MAKIIRIFILPFLVFFSFSIGRLSKEEKFVLSSPTEGGGMFFNMINVLGFLYYCEKNKIKSFQVDFKNQGHYYENALGNNWWEYFFTPINYESSMTKLASMLNLCKISYISQTQIAFFNYCGEFHLSRKKAQKLIEKYVHVQPEILKEVTAFKKKFFDGYYVIGVHYRGTDKYTEAPEVKYQEVKLALEQVIHRLGDCPYRIFIATDTQKFLDFISMQFPNHVFFIDATRSTNGEPLHYGVHKENLYYYARGEEALIDALLLSQVDFLIRTSSNLSLCSTFFNPDLSCVELNKKYLK